MQVSEILELLFAQGGESNLGLYCKQKTYCLNTE